MGCSLSADLAERDVAKSAESQIPWIGLSFDLVRTSLNCGETLVFVGKLCVSRGLNVECTG